MRRRIRSVVLATLTTVVLVFAARTLWQQWVDVGSARPQLELRPGWLLSSCLVIFLTHVLLIETWRRVLILCGARVYFLDAARVWTVSNLGKYVPGKIWQLSAMTVMMQRLGVSPVASGGAAVLVTAANVVAGLAIALGLGAGASTGSEGSSRATLIVILVAGVTLIALPRAAPRLSALLARIRRRPAPAFNVPLKAAWLAVLGCGVAWLAYGVAFHLFTVGTLGHAAGNTLGYVAAFAGSYLAGYIALFAPGGIGVREIALATALPALGLATPPEASLVTVASRLWLTALEVLPGLFLLAVRRRERR